MLKCGRISIANRYLGGKCPARYTGAMFRPILIAGPTASGKSALALRLARVLGGHVINADALQVYDCWQVLTARPSAEEESQAPHHLYGHVGRDAAYSVGHWLRDVKAVLAAVDGPPIIIGGSGLYFFALTEGLADIPATPAGIRKRATEATADSLRAELARTDPATAARIDMANPVRVRRAWEVLHTTGQGLAAWHDQTPPPLVPPGAAVRAVLGTDRDWLNHRINLRLDMMMATGALAEVGAYVRGGWNPSAASARAIGAKELARHLHGALDLSTAVHCAKIQTQKYAKRQRTWFRKRMCLWTRVNAADTDRATERILKSHG